MHPAIKTTHQKKIERIEELFEQLVIDTVTAALINLIDRYKNLPKPTTTRTCHNPNCSYSDDIQF